ncbi:hypothetical protein [Deinococcus enclensis]|uniref:Uncharacterized protein n=1 Tax=Deinococcus enclensis TaxID=1049582 RepID=A0ABT9MIX4_9DEIO|nr:hypothetical protein [Deinococcus enclensis]MDP9766540.1 hypothetical protein [Deinococcus enclensis]
MTRRVHHWKDADWHVLKHFPHDPWLDLELQTMVAQLTRLCFDLTEQRLEHVAHQRHVHDGLPGWALHGTVPLYFNLEPVLTRWRTPAWDALLVRALQGVQQDRELRAVDAEALTRHAQTYLAALLDAVLDTRAVTDPQERHRLAAEIASLTLQPRPPLRA